MGTQAFFNPTTAGRGRPLNLVGEHITVPASGVLAPVEIRTYSLARWRFCRQHRVAAMESGAADVGRAPRGALWNPMTMMKLLMLGAAAA